MREVELKLALDPADVPALLACAVLAGSKRSTKRFFSIYFDTPTNELAANGMALRLRREGRKWIQALKAGASGGGGLHERSEWEFARRDASVDLSLFAATPLAKLDDAARLHERLVEVFRVDMRRTAWTVEPVAGTRVEVVLDRGTIEALGRAAPVCEVEVESIAGETAEIFNVAAKLMDEVALRPSTVSKAGRGYRLRAGKRLAPLKASPVELDKNATADEAARAVLANGLAQYQANIEGVLERADPEFVHQARVALRRMRSSLRIFRDVVGPERAEAWRTALGETGRALGGARDWDVFGTEGLPQVLTAFADVKVTRRLRSRAARRRGAERDAARAALRLRAHGRVVLELAAWLAAVEPTAAAEPVADFASRLIRKRHKRLVADARRFGSLTADERHRLRIDVKRLRYGVDALASVFPKKRVQRYIDILVALQDALGEANDAVNAGRLLPELMPPPEFAAFARGWFAARSAGDPATLETLLEALAATPRFWQKARVARDTGGNVGFPAKEP